MTARLPLADHALRHVKPRLRDGASVSGAAFLPRPGETGVSCNWLEFLAGSEEERLIWIRSAARLAYARSGCQAKLHIGGSMQAAKHEIAKAIAFVHDPLAAEPDHVDPRRRIADGSHALLKGMPNVDDPRGELAGDAIARSLVTIYPAVLG